MQRWAIAVLFGLCLLIAQREPAGASLLGEIAELAARSGKVSGKLGAALDELASALARLPAEVKATTFAAEVTSEGAWRLRSAVGETITANEVADLPRVMRLLAPELAKNADAAPTLLIDEATLFNGRDAIAGLPGEVRLTLIRDTAALPLIRQVRDGRLEIFAERSAHLVVAAEDASRFAEAMWRLDRLLAHNRLRLLSLDANAKGRLPVVASAARDGAVRFEPVAAFELDAALGNLSGQTAIIAGRIEGPMLRFADASGVERTLTVDDVFAAAERNGVDLILLGADQPTQPGVRNWLFRETSLANLDQALKGATFGDFYSALARGQERLVVRMADGQGGHLRLSARPSQTGLPAASGAADSRDGLTLLETTLQVLNSPLGDLAVKQVESTGPSREVQEERDLRILPFLPSIVHIGLGMSVAAGLFGMPMLIPWSNWLWRRWRGPGAKPGWWSRLRERLLFWLVLVPLLGFPAFIATLIDLAVQTVLLPIRLMLRLFSMLRA